MMGYKALFVFAFLVFRFVACLGQELQTKFITYATNGANIKLYWKDDKGKIFGSIQNLKSFIEKQNEELVFATNGGMYKVDHSPQGLFI